MSTVISTSLFSPHGHIEVHYTVSYFFCFVLPGTWYQLTTLYRHTVRLSGLGDGHGGHEYQAASVSRGTRTIPLPFSAR